MKVLKKMETLQRALQGVENSVSELFAAMEALKDVQAAKVLELQYELNDLECTAAVATASQHISHLSPATDLCQREIF